MHKFLCNQIKHRKSILNNRIKLLFHSFLQAFINIFPIKFLKFLVSHFPYFIFCPINFRRIESSWNWTHLFYHIAYFMRIFHNDFLSHFFSQIIKRLQHFFSSFKIQFSVEKLISSNSLRSFSFPHCSTS